MPITEDIKVVLELQQQAYRDAVQMLFSTVNFERLNHLERKNAELTVSLQFTQKEVDDLKQENKHLKEEIKQARNNASSVKTGDIGDRVEKLSRRVDYQEDYSRRNNIRIHGVPESSWENWEMTQEKVGRMLRDQLGLEEVQLERAHRVGAPNHSSASGPSRPRTIITRFTRFTDREQALRNSAKLRNTNIYINEDLCEASVQIRKEKLPELKKARSEGKIAYFSHTKLIIKERGSTENDMASGEAGPESVITGDGETSAASVAGRGGRLTRANKKK